MYRIQTTILTLSGVLLLLLSSSVFAEIKIKSIEGCILKTYYDRGKETNLINLKDIDVFRYSNLIPGMTKVTLIYGGTGFIEIGPLPSEIVNELIAAYKKCVN